MSGGGLGTGAGGLLGTLAGVALAPETGGLSLAIPAAMGAAGSELGNLATGNTVNPLMAAVMGGVAGGLGGATDIGGSLGIGNSAGLFGDAAGTAATDTGASALSSVGNGASNFGAAGTNPALIGGQQAPAQLGGMTMPSLDTSGIDQMASGAANGAGSGGSSSGSGLMNWLGTGNHAAVAAGVGLPLLQGIAQQFTLPKYNVQKNANSVLNTSPGFTNPNLPQYSMQNTATPYAGNWYTYGQQPEQPLYNARPIATGSKMGGMIGYSHGGSVRGYAMGGSPLPPAMGVAPMPQQAIPQGMPPINPLAMGQPPQRPPMPPQGGQPAKPINPLALKAAHEIGVAIGEHIKKKRMTPDGRVAGQGGGQDDVVPARLSKDEYVVPADVTSALGDGSSEAGAKKLDQMRHNVRAHKTSKGSQFPPRAKNPLAYIPKKASS